MAKSKIIWSHPSKIKLFEILEYYAEKNNSKEYSIKLYKRFINTMNLLQKHPDLGKKTKIENVMCILCGTANKIQII